VLLNLCLNARDAMPHGGRLEIETYTAEAGRALRESHPWVEPGRMVGVRVRDEGHGMDAETLERAFDPFFTTKEVGQGTGLGLSSAYGIVRQHGGVIRATSAPDKGTAVEVLLPPTD
jgi:signal transduction histidine kinase